MNIIFSIYPTSLIRLSFNQKLETILFIYLFQPVIQSNAIFKELTKTGFSHYLKNRIEQTRFIIHTIGGMQPPSNILSGFPECQPI